MELKSPWGEGARVMGAGSNRTFMELKWISCFKPVKISDCSNRTFMELKWLLQF